MSTRDLISSSVARLEPLPSSRGQGGDGGISGDTADDAWVEETKERAERGSADAQFSLGQYHFAQGSYEAALQCFQAAEAKGNNQARYQLAVMLYDGLGTHQDPKQGFQYMLRVAQSEMRKDSHLKTGAEYNIGRAYFQGYGVEQSDEEAEKWWVKAGEGDGCWEDGGKGGSVVRAQNTLGMFYSREETLDLGKSFHWHSRAAENGHLESMAAVGLMSIHGRGCPQDEPAGLQWLKQAAEGGSLYGIGLLTLHYFTNKLFTKAAESAYRVSDVVADPSSLSLLECQGVALGCFTLARCLQLGQAVRQNEEKAMQYYSKARDYNKATVAELHSQIIHGQL